MAKSKAPVAKKTTAKPATKKAVAKKAEPKKVTAKPARKVPAVSPSKGMSVDDWIKAKVSGWQAEGVHKVIAIVKKAAPSATVSIKWGQPVFQSDGAFAFVRGAKAHLTVGFWRGFELSDPKGILEGEGKRMAHAKFKSLSEIDEKMLAAWVMQAVKLNAEKGDPSVMER